MIEPTEFFNLSKMLRELDLAALFKEVVSGLDNIDSDDKYWQPFFSHKLLMIKDDFDSFSITLRKMFIDYYHEKVCNLLTNYYQKKQQ